VSAHPDLTYLTVGNKELKLDLYEGHADKPMQIMADLIRRGKLAEEVMKVMGTEEKGDERVSMKPGRNEPCFCGSGLKFKKCHAKQK